MHEAFGTVIFVVCGVAIVAAIVALMMSGRTWSEYGKSSLLMDRDTRASGSSAASAPTSQGEREAEIRELLEARNARRVRRGEEPLDVEEEFARLTAPAPSADPELREEVRQLVEARNHRRVRAGRPPLDVEAEVERELRKLGELPFG